MSWRWIGCFGALVAALGLTVCSIASYGSVSSMLTIALLAVAMIALVGGLWQYNQARFESVTHEH